ncbi:hypothetical protein CEXT_136611 [Caerostris extrusa]|uniref:Uncharacterized protein n=1 Tax=Caerostris extrusa TaxID=172846 RepID=A0AAV4X9J3_CAEEX|nr:hypothetical protein CEXT_136611 [Caerostris extrusa]
MIHSEGGTGNQRTSTKILYNSCAIKSKPSLLDKQRDLVYKCWPFAITKFRQGSAIIYQAPSILRCIKMANSEACRRSFTSPSKSIECEIGCLPQLVSACVTWRNYCSDLATVKGQD